jgi:hypothetical protein
MMRDPEAAEFGLDIAAEPWIEGLEEGAWSKQANAAVAAILAAAGLPLNRGDPEFAEARDKVARALVWANRSVASWAGGQMSFRPPDPLFTTPVPATAREGPTCGHLLYSHPAACSDDRGHERTEARFEHTEGHIHSCKRFAAFLNRSPDTATAEARSPVSDAPLCRFRATVNTVWALIRQGMGIYFFTELGTAR